MLEKAARRAFGAVLAASPLLLSGCPLCRWLPGNGQLVHVCGTLVEGVECILFQTADGRRFVLSDHGSFQVGQRVEVAGWVDPDCLSICQQGDGCITVATISECFE